MWEVLICGFTGFSNFTKDIYDCDNTVKMMNKDVASKDMKYIKGRYYKEKNICAGYRSDINEEQLMTMNIYDNTYMIVYNGKIYNTKEIKENLRKNNFSFEKNSDTEILLKGYIHYGTDIVKHINGAFSFAIWNSKKQELFLARDHFGVKPLYYSLFNDNLVFSSEIKTILQFPNFEIKIDNQGISELFGIGPAHTPGTCIFKDIYDLKPAHFLIYNKSGVYTDRYWKLESKPHTDDFNTTCNNVKNILENSIKSQIISDLPLCSFLSGGLDSSIISLYAAEYYKENKRSKLNTFSVDYIDNDKNFVKNDFQPNSDKHYIDIITDLLKTNHQTICIDTPELADSLKDAMIARAMPRNGRY